MSVLARLTSCLGILLLTALVVSLTPDAAPGQAQKDKKDEKKKEEPKKTDDKKEVKKEEKRDDSKIEVYQGKDGWRFRVVGPDGKSVAIGVQGYAKKEDCLAAVDVVKVTLGKAKVVELPKD